MYEKHENVCLIYQQFLFCHASIIRFFVVYCNYSKAFPSRHYLQVVTTGEPGHCLRVPKREVATPPGWLGYSRKNLDGSL